MGTGHDGRSMRSASPRGPAPSRRNLLRAGLGIAGAHLLSACSAPSQDDPQTSAQPSRGTSSPPVEPTPEPRRWLFAGQPPAGQIYFGASVPYYRQVDQWEDELG